jgi:hypothetical protein
MAACIRIGDVALGPTTQASNLGRKPTSDAVT